MAVTRISEMNVFPLKVAPGEEKTQPCLLAEAKDFSGGDATGGATTFKPRITDAKKRFGDLFYLIDVWRWQAAGAVAQNVSLQLGYSAWENYYLGGIETELYYAAAIQGQGTMIAPNPAHANIKRYLGRLAGTTFTVEVQLKSNVNTNGVTSIIYIAILGFKERPIIPGVNTH